MLKTIQHQNFIWHNIIKLTKTDVKYLKDNFKLHPVNLNDARASAQHPKIDDYNEYIFLVLLFPIYNRKTQAVTAEEIDFILTGNNVITIHNNKLQPIKELFNSISKDKIACEKFFLQNSALMLYGFLDKLVSYCFPMLNHMSEDIENIENHIFKEQEKKMVTEILVIKRNIVNFRKTMQCHKDILKRILQIKSPILDKQTITIYFKDLIDRSKQMWAILESQNETINALHATNESLISFKLNDIMKTLTVFSVIVFPLTLLAAIFGMNTANMPLASHAKGFWQILGLMIIGTFFMLGFFKYKKWI